MPFTIIAVGRQREAPFKAAALEYQRRLTRYCKLDVREVQDEREPDRLSEALIVRAMEAEGRRVLDQVKPGDIVVALCVEGRQVDSLAFSRLLEDWHTRSAQVCFVIGGSLGLSGEVLNRADLQLSLSNMTLPHQLARVVLLEQMYRGFKIISGERYHK